MLFERFVQTAARFPDRLAVVDPHHRLTFRQLRAMAVRLGHRLAALSPDSQDPVAILMPTSTAFAAAFYALQSAGRVVVPLNFLLAGPELAGVVADSGARLIVSSRLFQPLAEGLSAAVGPARLQVVYLEDFYVGLAEDSLDARPDGLRPGRPIDADQTAVLLYTSGSTGQPKGVMLTAGNLLADADGCIAQAAMGPDEHFLGVLPLFHTFGLTALLVIPGLLGATAHYLPRFSPRLILEAIARQPISLLMAIPSIYGAMLKAAVAEGAPADLSRCRLLISGGEPLAPALAKAFEARFGRPILEGYGLTETSPVVSLNVPWAHRPGTVGRPLPNVRVRILDDRGAPLPTGRPGEIVVDGPIVMKGYYRRPQETAAVLTADGALRTGDLGYLDHDGFLTVSGRIKDLIIVAGKNVLPGEVEQVLDSHPKVGRSAVVGVPDGTRGETIAAYVMPADPADPPDPIDLRAFCRDRLAAYKIPRLFELRAELPVGPTGKILKRQLQPGPSRPPVEPPT